MSGAAFEGLTAREDDSEEQSYEPGESAVDDALIRELARLDALYPGCDGDSIRQRISDALGAHPPDPADADTFIEALLRPFEMGECSSTGYLDILLSACVQDLYGRGADSFTIDFTRLPPGAYYTALSGLVGKPERPLAITCRGKLYEVGSRAEHCAIRLDGEATHGGSSARSSEFTLAEGAPGYRHAGLWAEDSSFEVRSPQCIPFMMAPSFIMGDSFCLNSWKPPSSTNCTYDVHSSREQMQPAMKDLVLRGFFGLHNRLFIPVEGERWGEVTAEVRHHGNRLVSPPDDWICDSRGALMEVRYPA